MWYSENNAEMHCGDVVMGIGTSFYVLVMFDWVTDS